MAQYSRNFTTECPGDLLDDINANPSIDNTLHQIIKVAGTEYIFEFAGTLTAAEETELDTTLANWECPPNITEVDEVIINDGATSPDELWSSQQVAAHVATEVAAAAAGDLSAIAGKLFSAGFAHSSSSVGNAWLRTESNDSGASSDRVPFIIPFNCRLVSATFANASSGCDCDVQIWSSPFSADPETNKTNMYEFQVRNNRSVVQTVFGSPIPAFNAGDKVGVYLRDQGTNSNHPVVQLTFIVVDNTVANLSDTFSNNFSTTSDDDDD